MYIVQWKEDNDFFTNNPTRHWSSVKKNAFLFPSKEEAEKTVLNIDSFWTGKIVVIFMHPLNLNPV